MVAAHPPRLRALDPALAQSTRQRFVAALTRLRVERVVTASALLAGMVLLLVEAPFASRLTSVPVAVAFVLVAVHVGSLPLAAIRPSAGAVLGIVGALALEAVSRTSGPLWPWWPVLIVTQTLILAVAGTRARWPVALLHWVVAVGTSAMLAAVLRPESPAATNVVTFGAVSGATLVVAVVLAQWARIRDELVHERRIAAEEATRVRLMQERTRIARELHDVIAHSMSIITVQSTTARFRHPGFDETAIKEFDEIGALSRGALDEMRSLLRVLRTGDDDRALRPQPGIGDLADLVAQALRAGKPVTLTELPERDRALVSEVTGLATYRIVQEALSNAIRHAPGAAVQVHCERIGNDLRIDVVNSAAVEQPGATDEADAAGAGRGGGHGLIGMAERAASVGGSVTFGRTQDDGFAIHAVLPLRGRLPT